jgi:hypothetical protein
MKNSKSRQPGGLVSEAGIFPASEFLLTHCCHGLSVPLIRGKTHPLNAERHTALDSHEMKALT